jgi:hypothetical protein
LDPFNVQSKLSCIFLFFGASREQSRATFSFFLLRVDGNFSYLLGLSHIVIARTPSFRATGSASLAGTFLSHFSTIKETFTCSETQENDGLWFLCRRSGVCW